MMVGKCPILKKATAPLSRDMVNASYVGSHGMIRMLMLIVISALSDQIQSPHVNP